MPEVAYSPENLQRLTLATWMYLLHRAGVDPADPGLAASCAAVDAASDPDAAGWELVGKVGSLLGEGAADPAAVTGFASRQYGDALATDMGSGDRAQRTSRMRRYQFGRRLPWLARVYQRSQEAEVRAVWLVIESVTDEVIAMDPNPWNDIDEERRLAVADFHVLWELDGCRSLRIDG